ncbi:MAG: transglutaminase domain-containing protein, partial [Micromonosporaceae bacterium]|nr:transglutaminase domain-containing protein [Micromonosporaceae bacterium]
MVTVVLRRLGLALVVAALVALAGLSLNRVYNGLLLALLVAGAAVGSTLISALLRRLPAVAVAPLSVLALLGYAVYAIAVSAEAGGVAGDVPTLAADAARNAVPRLLTALIPAEPQPDTVLAPVVLAWLAGYAGTELAVRAGRPAVALLPPTLLYVGALVLVGPNAEVTLWQPLLYAVLCAVGLVVGSASSGATAVRGLGPRQRALLRVRTASGLAVGLAAILALVAALSPLVAGAVGQRPGDPRRYVQPPSLDVIDLNPLIRISGWAAFPEQELFEVEILDGAAPAPSATPEADQDGAPGPAPEAGIYDRRLRLAVLPDWDGVTWHMDADYRSAGRVLPPVPPPPGFDPERPNPIPPLTVIERITIAELRGRLLPAVASPTRVEGIRVAYDQTSGTLLSTTPVTAGMQYTVTSVSTSVDTSLAMAADVPDGDEVARYLAVGPTVPSDLSQFAQKITQGENSPYLRALRLQTFMQEHYILAADAPSGHAYPNLSFFLLADRHLGGQRGTSEQFATAFATLGRLIGLPTRVVVGFSVPAGGGMVTAGDAVAWPEVLFAGIGWVPFDPRPLPNTVSRPVEPEFMPAPPPSTAPPESISPSEVTASADASATGGPGDEQAAGPSAASIATIAGVAVVGAILIALIVVVVLRAVQTRRRLTASDPAARVVGAWDEVVDGLMLSGHPPPAHLSAAELADYAGLVVAGSPGGRPTR